MNRDELMEIFERAEAAAQQARADLEQRHHQTVLDRVFAKDEPKAVKHKVHYSTRALQTAAPEARPPETSRRREALSPRTETALMIAEAVASAAAELIAQRERLLTVRIDSLAAEIETLRAERRLRAVS